MFAKYLKAGLLSVVDVDVEPHYGADSLRYSENIVVVHGAWVDGSG